MKIQDWESSPRPWHYLRNEGQFIVDANGDIVAEIPCQGCNDNAGDLIVLAVNSLSDQELEDLISEAT